MKDNFIPTFDVDSSLEYMREYNKRILSDKEREEWKQTLKELREDIPLQLKRQDFSASTLHNIIG